MSKFDKQFLLQGGRCFWHGALVPIQLMTRDHIYTRHNGDRARGGNEYVLACEKCNTARAGLRIGSLRFRKWLKRTLHGRIYKFIRRETFVNYGPS